MSTRVSHVRPLRSGCRDRRDRRGLTLTELLVSITIMILLLGAAIPILRPISASTKTGEASRMVQAMLNEARTLAAQKQRLVGVMLDTSLDPKTAVDVQDRDAVTKLYLAEVPPLFQGTLGSSCVVISNPRTDPEIMAGLDPDPLAARQAYVSNGGGSVFAYMYFFSSPNDFFRVNTLGNVVLPEQSVDALIPPGGYFRIRFNGTGPWYEAVREPAPGTGGSATRMVRMNPTVTSARYRIQMSGLLRDNAPTLQPASFGSSDKVFTSVRLPLDSNGIPYGTGTAARPEVGNPLKYQIMLAPIRSGSTVYELPAGSCIDLRCSGFGHDGYALGDTLDYYVQTEILPGAPVYASQNPVLLFQPNGTLDSLSGILPTGALHLLVGSRKRMAEITQPVIAPNGARVTDYNTGTISRDDAYGNLRDGSSVWITVNNRTGAVSTSNVSVVPPGINLGGARAFQGGNINNPIGAEFLRRTQIGNAREYAHSLNTKGGL